MSTPSSNQHQGHSVCQFGLPRSGLYAVADWYIDSAARPFVHIRGGWLDDIQLPREEVNRFVTFEAFRLEILRQGLQRSSDIGAITWIQLRDPYNWLASLQRGVKSHRVNWRQPVSLSKWKDYARMCAGGHQWISFNRWFRDAEYRRTLAARFHFLRNLAGEPLQRVPARGGGSSFNGLRYRDRAQAMAVLDRYKQFLDDLEWRAHFDDEAVALADALFDVKRPW
jgi:hypothetical protein